MKDVQTDNIGGTNRLKLIYLHVYKMENTYECV